MVAIWLSLIVGLLIIRLLYKWMTEPSLPPGPPGLPLVGNTLQVDPTGLHKTVFKWSKTYGGVFTINLLGQNIEVLTSSEAIYEALVLKDDDFSGRPPFYRTKVLVIYHLYLSYILTEKRELHIARHCEKLVCQ